MKPWFPEVSERGEWERRERHYRRYLPKATRVIVPGETGREQVVRFFGVDPDNCLALKHPTPDFALEAAEAERRPEELVRKRGDRAARTSSIRRSSGRTRTTPPSSTRSRELRSRASRCARPRRLRQGPAGACPRARSTSAGSATRCTCSGWVDEDELIGLYQHAHALVYLEPLRPREPAAARGAGARLSRDRRRTCPAPKSSSATLR